MLLVINGQDAQENQPPVWNTTSLAALTDGVKESTPIGTELTVLHCTDPENDTVLYTKSQGDSVRVATNGSVYLLKRLDYEKENSRRQDLKFTCVDRSHVNNPQETSTFISVSDANDNAPEFQVNSADGYTWTISEDAVVGTTLLPLVSTVDIDVGPNAELSKLYLICNSPDPLELVDQPESSIETCEKFSLEYKQKDEGEYEASFTLKSPLNYETRRTYSSKLVAIDGGLNAVVHLEAITNVRIIVDDVPDVPPLITNGGQPIIIPENTPQGTFLNFAVTARDGDTGVRAPLDFSIIFDPGDVFRLDEPQLISPEDGYSATLIVNNPLDREQQKSPYEFVVKVTELENGQLTSATATQTFTVVLTDKNDNKPTFEQERYEIYTRELATTVSGITQITGLRIQCSDADEQPNNIYTIKVVDQYFAYAGGRLPFNAYSISPMEPFYTNAVNLFLQTEDSRILDYDDARYREQVVVLQAQELGTAELYSSTTEIHIFLLDMNDNTPRFLISNLTLNIPENVQPLPSVVANITAVDIDSGQNGNVTYSLRAETLQNVSLFTIEKTTGILRLAQPLDYERVTELAFQIIASDQGDPPRSSQILALVNIINTNDQRPIFKQSKYSTSVNESSLIFIIPITVQAVDKENQDDISYRIVDGQPENRAFTLNRITGELGLRATLDYEKTMRDPVTGATTGKHVLTVEASDNQVPPLTSTVPIEVTVVDINNHGPQLRPSRYQATIPELAKAGYSVSQITATDKDIGPFGELSYRIIRGASDNFEMGSESGLLSVARTGGFDYDDIQTYILEVLVEDGGAPARVATATVTVDLTDNNNKDPKFSAELYLKTEVDENTPIGENVQSVRATDADRNNKLVYSILTSQIQARDPTGQPVTDTSVFNFREAFGIDSNANIFVKNKLNKDLVEEISLVVLVNDTNTEEGLGFDTAQVTFIIVGEPTRIVKFDPVAQVSMDENSPVGEASAIRVTARNAEKQEVSNYEILPNSSPKFGLGSLGEIILIGDLDYENDINADHLHRVIVKAQEGQESATATVTVSVSDVNDNAPQFGVPIYKVDVLETAVFPKVVATIYATDADSSRFGPLTFRIVGGLGAELFEIFDEDVVSNDMRSKRASIIVAKGAKLDFAISEEYNLDLIVLDNAVDPNEDDRSSFSQKSGKAQLIIRVIDQNNHAPIFINPNPKVAVLETAQLGQIISFILATDQDSGDFGEIIYFLEPLGNSESSQTALRLFKIASNGALQVADRLVGLGGQTFSLRVVAINPGDIPNRNHANVQVTVLSTEDNDGTPKWNLPENGYIVYAPEETPGYVLTDDLGRRRFFDVTARTGTEITFSLSEYGRYAHSFSIDQLTGEITIDDSLDRERQEIYEILVYAEDTVDPLKYRTARQLIVQLLDKNDNNATFQNPKGYQVCKKLDKPQVVNIKENTPENKVIYTVKACDPDYGADGEIEYELYNDNDYCAENNAAAKFTLYLEPAGPIVTLKRIDYEEDKEFRICVIGKSKNPAPASPTRKKRFFDVNRVDTDLDNVAYLQINVQDQNDNGPKFKHPTAIAVVQTHPNRGHVMMLDAVDPDGPTNNVILYRIESSVFYPLDGSAPVPYIGAFSLKGEKPAIFPSRSSYADNSGGRFVLSVVAVDSRDNSKTDKQTVTIYVHEKGQAMKVILPIEPAKGVKEGKPLVHLLDDVSDRYTFTYLQASEHRSTSGIDPSKTDICFLAVDGVSNTILNIRQVVDLLNQGRYQEVFASDDKYSGIDRGQCYAVKSSEEDIKWRDLWWVLVAVAIFIFVCCIIFIIVVTVLYNRHKRYMETSKTYMVAG